MNRHSLEKNVRKHFETKLATKSRTTRLSSYWKYDGFWQLDTKYLEIDTDKFILCYRLLDSTATVINVVGHRSKYLIFLLHNRKIYLKCRNKYVYHDEAGYRGLYNFNAISDLQFVHLDVPIKEYICPYKVIHVSKGILFVKLGNNLIEKLTYKNFWAYKSINLFTLKYRLWTFRVSEICKKIYILTDFFVRYLRQYLLSDQDDKLVQKANPIVRTKAKSDLRT